MIHALLNKEYVAVLDTCVLAPMPLCDTLLRCTEEPALFHALWSNETLEELQRTLVKFGFTHAQAEHRLKAMRQAFPDACVQIPATLLDAVPEIPDPGDRHVVAAAICRQAQTIVTLNLRHFPRKILEPIGISVYSPDEFLVRLFRRNPDEILEVLNRQASAIGQPRSYVQERLKVKLPEFVALVGGRQG
jgi:predicted nucleic acid-binding protein